VLELILEFQKQYTEVDMKYLALIRNPMDTLYSMWKRWYAIPEIRQFEWLRAYKNLTNFMENNYKNCFFIKYEDMVTNSEKIFQKIYEFMGLDKIKMPHIQFHKSSIGKWKTDRIFGFNLDPQVYRFSHKYYTDEELRNNNDSVLWNLIRILSMHRFDLIITKRKMTKFIKDKMKRILR